ncbi:ABC transporter permease [Cohnella caldifontis]|uniref:ABC transporter permease n=1 Tax=Cohnella caldifontis TaxID=3027471 RepID=UPI0023ED2E54|nr:ABC transporter permease [Cohnella sp. YIM B05605]
MNASGLNLRKHLNKHMLELILLVIFIAMSFASSGFFTIDNILNIFRNIAMQGIIAFGMTMVIIAGEIDLSVGSTVALSGVTTGAVTGWLANHGGMPMDQAVIVGMIVSLVLAGLIGLFNGFILTKYKLPSFIITLAMLNVVYGAAAVMSGGFPVTTLPSWYNVLGSGEILSIPVPAIILLLIFAIIFVVMKYTKFGRSVYAVGGNPESARLSGINVGRVKIVCMVVVQLLSALSGILLSSQVMSGAFSFGKGWELIVISAVIIGGTSLFGGIGKVWGTFVGLVFLGVLINAMTILNVNEYVQYIVRGCLILVAVLITTIQIMKRRS